MPTFFLAKKYRSGWSKENRENRVIVYPTIFLKWFCIGYRPIFVIKFLSYYYIYLSTILIFII